MIAFVALLRGINVGGNHSVRMADLVASLSEAGFEDVRTHLQSGNVLFRAPSARGLEVRLEGILKRRFGFDIPVIVRSRAQLAATIKAAPDGHGSASLRSDVFFLKAPLTASQVLASMPDLREGVDSVAEGPGAVYFSRVAENATKTHIQKFMAMPIYKQLSARNWKTTTRLLDLLGGG